MTSRTSSDGAGPDTTLAIAGALLLALALAGAAFVGRAAHEMRT